MLKKKLARIISEISNGFMTMILAPLITIASSSLHLKQKVLYSVLYILTPLLPYFVLKKMGKISDYELTDRKERPLYFTILALLFGLMYLILRNIGIETLTTVSFNIFIVSSVVTFITYFWKISGHTTYSTLLFISLIYLSPSPYLFVFFLLTPFIAWSRIVLEKHNITQVTMGTLVTLTVSILIYWGF